MQVHQWKVRRPVTVVPQTAMNLLVCLMTVCFTTLLALVNSSWAEYKGCTRKEPKDLSSMFAPLTLVTNQQMSVIASKYCRTSEDSHLYYHQETVVAMPLTSLICKVHLEIIKTKKEKMTFMRYLRRIHVSSPNFFKVWKHSKGHPRLLVKEMLDPWLLTWKMMAEGWILSLHQVEDLAEEFHS